MTWMHTSMWVYTICAEVAKRQFFRMADSNVETLVKAETIESLLAISRANPSCKRRAIQLQKPRQRPPQKPRQRPLQKPVRTSRETLQLQKPMQQDQKRCGQFYKFLFDMQRGVKEDDIKPSSECLIRRVAHMLASCLRERARLVRVKQNLEQVRAQLITRLERLHLITLVDQLAQVGKEQLQNPLEWEKPQAPMYPMEHLYWSLFQSQCEVEQWAEECASLNADLYDWGCRVTELESAHHIAIDADFPKTINVIG